MSPISDQDLEDYLQTNGWKGKAGAFGYQDRLGWVSILAGEESTVVGLPLRLLRDMLHEFGLTPPDPTNSEEMSE
jgi:septum formation protein